MKDYLHCLFVLFLFSASIFGQVTVDRYLYGPSGDAGFTSGVRVIIDKPTARWMVRNNFRIQDAVVWKDFHGDTNTSAGYENATMFFNMDAGSFGDRGANIASVRIARMKFNEPDGIGLEFRVTFPASTDTVRYWKDMNGCLRRGDSTYVSGGFGFAGVGTKVVSPGEVGLFGPEGHGFDPSFTQISIDPEAAKYMRKNHIGLRGRKFVRFLGTGRREYMEHKATRQNSIELVSLDAAFYGNNVQRLDIAYVESVTTTAAGISCTFVFHDAREKFEFIFDRTGALWDAGSVDGLLPTFEGITGSGLPDVVAINFDTTGVRDWLMGKGVVLEHGDLWQFNVDVRNERGQISATINNARQIRLYAERHPYQSIQFKRAGSTLVMEVVYKIPIGGTPNRTYRVRIE